MHEKNRKALEDSLDPIIDNGSLVQMGIFPEGHLNVPGGTPSFQSLTTDVGLRFIPTNGEGTAPGCLCEGWGVANAHVDTGTFSAWASVANGGVVNLTVQPSTGITNPTGHILPESQGSAYKSIVRDNGGRVQVTHDYKPSTITANLYEVEVTIENIGADTIGDLRYRRDMDWDIPPTTFSEWVEIHVGEAENLLRATTDGFDLVDPLSILPPSAGAGAPPTTLVPGDPDYFGGRADQGALFDFSFGELLAGESVTFKTYYGAAVNRAGALAAVGAVQAEVYSFGFPSDPVTGGFADGPNVFIFAFGEVGGTPVVTADLEITKEDSPDPVRIGQFLTYTLTVTNNGPDAASNVTVVDTLPPEVDFVSTTSSQGTFVEAAGVITYSLGSLASGGSATIDIIVSPNTPGTAINSAVVSANEFDPEATNNSSVENTTILPAIK